MEINDLRDIGSRFQTSSQSVLIDFQVSAHFSGPFLIFFQSKTGITGIIMEINDLRDIGSRFQTWQSVLIDFQVSAHFSGPFFYFFPVQLSPIIGAGRDAAATLRQGRLELR
jgi:hypothetical protein